MPYTDPDDAIVLFQPGRYTFTVTAPLYVQGAAGVRLFWDVSSVAGSSVMVQIALYLLDPGPPEQLGSPQWTSPTVSSGPQTLEMTIYPNIQTNANQAFSDMLSGKLVVAAIISGGTPQVQMSLCAVPIW